MHLIFKGPCGTSVCDWESYAVLRDNVQHFLENGVTSARFKAIHDVEQAVDDGFKQVDGARLRVEVLRAWSALWPKTVAEAAISSRTRAILTKSSNLPAASRTVQARETGWPLPVEARAELPIPRAAGKFVSVVLGMTSTIEDGQFLEVRRVGEGPRFIHS